MAILQHNNSTDIISNIYRGVGSLIHPKVILTTAHFLANKNKDEFTIRAGEWNLFSSEEYFKHQDKLIEEIIIHEHFNRNNALNDIALVVLKTPIDVAENVNPICLPQHDYNFTGHNCFASGWGNFNWIMKRAELPLVSHATCEEQLRTTQLGVDFHLNSSFICAGGEGSACYRDGGSPLVCQILNTNNQYYQFGIGSWGIGCGGKIPGNFFCI